MAETKTNRRRKSKVLVVQEDAAAGEQLRKILERFDLNVVAVVLFGEDALKIAEKRKPDLILMDVQLSGELDGIETARQIRSRFHTPVIFLTDRADEATLQKARAVAPSAYLLRPPNEQELYAAIELTLGQKETAETPAAGAPGILDILPHGDGVWDWDLLSNRVRYSARWKALLGYSPDEIGDTPDEWFQLLHADEVQQIKIVLDSHHKGFTDSFEMEFRLRHKEGRFGWFLCRGLTLRDGENQPQRIIGTLSDIDRFKRREEQLLQYSLRDPLTQLPNRSLFLDHLERAIKVNQRYGERRFAVFHLEVCDLEASAERIGGLAAVEQITVGMASRLKSQLRPSDTLARLSGGNFAILLEEIQDITQALRIAERIRQVVALPTSIQNQEITCQARIGIVLSGEEYSGPEPLLRDADVAMHQVNPSEGGIQIFNPVLRNQATTRLQMEAQLRRALERNEFRIYYQPIVSLKTWKIEACEAFVRWEHPQLGILAAREFIGVAEETGLLMLLGNWVLKTACNQAKAWHMAKLPSVKLAVNISASQLRQKNLVPMVETILKETGLGPHFLQLEISERTVMENIVTHTEFLRGQADLGLEVVIDDFGTGFSSLDHLQHFPFSRLKIDQSFIQRIPEKEDGAAIATAIINLAHSLKQQVTAEGVETQAQLQFLADQGCDAFQGAVFCMPLPEKEVRNLLRASSNLNREHFFAKKR